MTMNFYHEALTPVINLCLYMSLNRNTALRELKHTAESGVSCL